MTDLELKYVARVLQLSVSGVPWMTGYRAAGESKKHSRGDGKLATGRGEKTKGITKGLMGAWRHKLVSDGHGRIFSIDTGI